MTTLPSLSIRQPWAWAIVHAGKDIENRSWSTNFRGRCLIHAAKGMTRLEYEECLGFAHGLSCTRPFPSGLTLPSFGSMPRGGIVGVVDIVDCVTESPSPWFSGRFGFVLRNARPLPFHPCKGRLGVCPVDYPHEVEAWTR